MCPRVRGSRRGGDGAPFSSDAKFALRSSRVKLAPRARWALALVTSLVAVLGVIVISGASPAALAAAVRRVGFVPFVIVALGWLLLLLAQTLRWRAVLAPVASRRFRELYLLRVVGQLVNAFLPARAGDLLRFDLLSRRSGVPRATLVGMEVVDQSLDKIGWAITLGIVAALGAPPAWLLRGAPVVLVIPVVALASVLLVRRVARPPAWLASLRRGLEAHDRSTLVLIGLFLAPLPWLIETAVMGLAARSASLNVDAIQAFAMLTALNVAYAIPVPGNAGTVESALAGALAAMGFPVDLGLAFGLVYHLGQLSAALLVGVPGVFVLRPIAAEAKVTTEG